MTKKRAALYIYIYIYVYSTYYYMAPEWMAIRFSDVWNGKDNPQVGGYSRFSCVLGRTVNGKINAKASVQSDYRLLTIVKG